MSQSLHVAQLFVKTNAVEVRSNNLTLWNFIFIQSFPEGCDAPDLENGYTLPNTDFFDHGQVANFFCNESYTLVGVSKSTCRNGTYDPSTLPTCYGRITLDYLMEM